MDSLQVEQLALYGYSSGVAPVAPGGRYDPMARNQNGQRVVPAGRADSPCGIRIPDGVGHLLVSAHLPVRDPVQLLHDPAPEIGAVIIQVEIELGPLPGQILVDLRGGLLERLRLILVHRRKVAAWEVHARDHPVPVLRQTYGPDKG